MLDAPNSGLNNSPARRSFPQQFFAWAILGLCPRRSWRRCRSASCRLDRWRDRPRLSPPHIRLAQGALRLHSCRKPAAHRQDGPEDGPVARIPGSAFPIRVSQAACGDALSRFRFYPAAAAQRRQEMQSVVYRAFSTTGGSGCRWRGVGMLPSFRFAIRRMESPAPGRLHDTRCDARCGAPKPGA